MVYEVSPNFDDNPTGHKFSTIQGAIDQAYADHSAVFGVTINVHPGTYTGQIHSYPGFFIKGTVHNSPSSEQRVVTIYDTGLTPEHYPLRANDGDGYVIHNINIKTASGGTFGRLGNDRFVSCNFSGGAFIESLQDVAIYETWSNCSFVSCPAFNVTGIEPQGRYLVFEDCWFGWWNTMRFESTHTTGNAVFDMDGGHLAFTKLSLKGDWYNFSKNYHSFGAYRHDFDTTKGIVYRNVTISNGIHFLSDPMSFKMIGCEMEDAAEMDIPDGEADITADVAITDVNFQNNSMHNGLSGEIEIQGKIRSVGGNEINKYISIQDAIDSLTSDGIIFLQPGTYTEQLHSRSEILIQGRTHEGVPAVKSTILYNTGADSAHYPLGGDDTDIFNISDITIKTEPDAVIGKLSASNFTGVVFQNGYFIEATANQAMLMGLSDCSFEDTMAFNLTGVGSGGLRAMTIVGCYFNNNTDHWVMNSTHTATLVIVKNTMFHEFYPDIGGDWNVEVSNSHCFGTSRSVISTTNKISYIQCIISNGLHFTSNPDVIMHLNTFSDSCGYAITGSDITASLDVTNVDYAQNVQQNGLAGEIKILDPIKNVGANAVNRYTTIQDAIDSITTKGNIRLHESYTGLTELSIPNNTEVIINGDQTHSLVFTGDIATLGLGEKLVLDSLSGITGTNVEIAGNNAEFHMHTCPCGDNTMQILATSGTSAKVHLRDTNITGATGYSPLQINSLDPEYKITASRLIGSTGQPAVEFTVEADNKFQTKQSAYIHGDGSANSPFVYTGANKVDFAVYACGLNATWNANDFTNTIGSAGNITDPNIDF